MWGQKTPPRCLLLVLFVLLLAPPTPPPSHGLLPGLRLIQRSTPLYVSIVHIRDAASEGFAFTFQRFTAIGTHTQTHTHIQTHTHRQSQALIFSFDSSVLK